MKKYIVISIIAVVALLPFAAWADTGGTAQATLTFDAVINMTVDGSDWDDLTIDQPLINTIAGGGGALGPIDWDEPDDDITVKVESFTPFKVYSSYWTADTTLLGSSPDGFIHIVGDSDFSLNRVEVNGGATGAFDYSGTPATSLLTELTDWTGNATIFGTPPYEDNSYNVQWDPTKLADDLKAGDSMDVTIYFVVTDQTT